MKNRSGILNSKIISRILIPITLISLVSCDSQKTEKDTPVVKVSDEFSKLENGKTSDGDIVINLAVSNYDTFFSGSDPVKEFNNMDNGYKISLIDYGEYYDAASAESDSNADNKYAEAYQNADNKICMDIIQGDKIDMTFKFFDDSRFISLAEKSAFVDLNKFMKDDPDINHNTLNEHIIDLCENEGRLYYMPISFTVKTLLGYEKYVGSNENWTINDMMERWAKMPEGSRFTGSLSINSADSIFYELIGNSVTSFVDIDQKKCYFDSDDFIDLLRFVKDFGIAQDYDKSDIVPGDFFIDPVTISGFNKFHNILWNEGNTQPLSFVGYPASEGSNSFIELGNTFAICSSADEEVQKGAWQFIKYLTSYDYQYSAMSAKNTENSEAYPCYGNSDELFFPMNNEAFEKRAEEAYSKEKEENIVSISGMEQDIGYFTHEEYDRLKAIIERTNQIFLNDNKIYGMTVEGTAEMLSGEISPEEEAKRIQSSVTFAINE